jgi:Kef-type K+ transport system membrane component KefB
MFSRSPEKERLQRGVSNLAYGFFVPVFFVNIGLSINVRKLDISVVWLFIAITVVAILGKFIGSGAGARLAGYSWRESAQLGAGMVSRGEVGLIIASVGSEQGLVNLNVFSAIVGMILVTTLLTPPMLKSLFTKPKDSVDPKKHLEIDQEIN